MTENEISRVVIDAAIEVHRTLGGPGLLESVYEEAFAYELELRGLKVERQRTVPVVYKGTSTNNPVFEAQALTYLRLMNLKLALVVNFGMRLVKDGISRVVNEL